MKIYKPKPKPAPASVPVPSSASASESAPDAPGSAPESTPESTPESAPESAPAANGGESTDQQLNDESLDEEVAEVYLVEPMRLTSTVIKYSGTLGSTTRTDMRSMTMAAFAHYVVEETACQYVFADIQGRPPLFYAHQCDVKFIAHYVS